MKKIILFIICAFAISTSYAQPNFKSSDMPTIGNQDTLMYLVYYGITNNLDTETGNGYTWDFSSLPFSMYPNFIQIDSFRVKQHFVSVPFTNATIEEYIYDGTAGDVNLFSFNNDTLYVHRLGAVVTGTSFVPPMASIAFPITFNDSSVIHASLYIGSSKIAERKTTTLYDGFGTLQMPNGKSYSNVFRIKKIEKDTNIFNNVITYISYIWYKQGGQVPLLRLTYTGASNLYFVFGSKSNNTSTGINERQDDRNVPTKFSLSQNYPNPFNPNTTISFNIQVPSFTSLKIYDAVGRETATLVNENLSAGSYEVKFDASQVPSGIYFYTLQTAHYSETKKMILIK